MDEQIHTERLAEAIEACDAAAVVASLAAGADPRARDDEGTLLVLRAAETGDVTMVRAFLDAGAPIDVADDGGWTPLFVAITDGNVELAELLIARGASCASREGGVGSQGDTVITAALSSPAAGALIPALLRAGADPNAPRGDGWTPLMLVAQDGPLEIARALLDAGGAVDASTGEGVTAADIAAHWQRDSMLELLKASGAVDPIDACSARMSATWAEIRRWFEVNAPQHAERLATAGGATPAAIDEAERAIGARFTTDLRAHFTLLGGRDGASFFEYGALSIDGALGARQILVDLAAQGRFDTFTPKELRPDDGRIRHVWWHPAWVPFAEDGGGNLLCVDLDPGEQGARGQVIAWELHAGPTGPLASSLEEHVRRYRDELLGGRVTFDAESGIFDRG